MSNLWVQFFFRKTEKLSVKDAFMPKRTTTCLDFRMIWCYSISNKPMRRPETVEYVNPNISKILKRESMEDSRCNVESRWASSNNCKFHDKHPEFKFFRVTSRFFGNIRTRCDFNHSSSSLLTDVELDPPFKST